MLICNINRWQSGDVVMVVVACTARESRIAKCETRGEIRIAIDLGGAALESLESWSRSMMPATSSNDNRRGNHWSSRQRGCRTKTAESTERTIISIAAIRKR